MPSNKLREATSGPKGKSVSINARESFEPAPVLSGPRSSRAKRAVVIESGSEDDEEDDEDTHMDVDVEDPEEDGEGYDDDYEDEVEDE